MFATYVFSANISLMLENGGSSKFTCAELISGAELAALVEKPR
jgi:hypothetical protein